MNGQNSPKTCFLHCAGMSNKFIAFEASKRPEWRLQTNRMEALNDLKVGFMSLTI